MAKRPQISDNLFNSISDIARLWDKNPDVSWEDGKSLLYAVLIKHGWRAPRGR